MARSRDDGTAELVQQIGRLKRLITELESEAIQHRSRAERQRAACARQLDEEAATVEAAIAQMSTFDAAAIRARREHAAALRSIAAEMRARAVVQ
jgi:hypothetical protein